MKKKILALMLVVSMLAVAVLSGTLAYFTDTDEAENVFTVGNVDIEIEEPNWKPDNSDKLENIVPGVSYDKDPQVKNVGSNPAYVRMTVCFQNGVNIGGLSSVEPESLTDMLKNISSNWTLVDEGLDMGVHFDGAHDNCWYVTFTYNEILEPGETTDPLFTAVQFPSSWDQNTFKNFIGDSFEIDVMAEAIQAEGFNSSAEAFAGLSGSTITTVSTTDELAAALDAGESVIGISGTEVELNYEVNNGVLETGAKLIGVTEDATLTFTGLGTGSVSVSLENLTVVDETCYESENGESAWEFTYLELTGKNTFRNVVFTDGIMIDGNADITCIDCTFIGHNNDSSTLSDVTMNGVWVLSGNATFRNCTFEGTRGIKVCDSNTSSTYASADVNVVVDNCTFDSLSEKPGVAIDYSGDTTIGFSVTIKNSTFIDCQPGDQNLYIYETDNYTPVLENNTVVSGTSVIVSSESGLNSALAAGSNVVLDKDITATADVTADSSLDLNGKTLTGSIQSKNNVVTLTVKNGTIDNNDADVSGIQFNAGTLTLKDVTVTSARHALRIEGDADVTIESGTYKVYGTAGKTTHALNVSDGATVTINGGTFVGPKDTAADSGSAVTVQAGSTVIINGGNFSGGKLNTLASKDAGTLIVYGGTFDQDPSAYVPEGYVVTDNEGGTWTVTND